jgi:hypothetical protein
MTFDKLIKRINIRHNLMFHINLYHYITKHLLKK